MLRGRIELRAVLRIAETFVRDVAGRQHAKLTHQGIRLILRAHGLRYFLDIAEDFNGMSDMCVHIHTTAANQIEGDDFRDGIGSVAGKTDTPCGWLHRWWRSWRKGRGLRNECPWRIAKRCDASF